MTNEKMIINTTGDQVLIGAAFHTLEDKTQNTFNTNMITEFCKSIMPDSSKDKEAVSIYCSAYIIRAWPNKVDRYTKPVSVCDLKLSTPLEEIWKKANCRMTLADFTAFLEKFKRYTDLSGLDFLSKVRHFKLKKILSVESNKAKNGDFNFRVALEAGGADDFAPPDLLKFTVPVYKFLPDLQDTIQLSFEVNFGIVQSETPEMNFTLNHFSIEEEILNKQTEIINRQLELLPQHKVWGSLDIAVQTDEWKYSENKLE